MRSVRPDLVELAGKYAGQWVAIDQDGSVVASGATARDVVDAAESKGISFPLILHASVDYGALATRS